MPFHSMTLSMRLANVPWVPRLPWGGKPAPGRSAARAVPRAVRPVRAVRGFTSIAPASLRRPGSSRPCSSRFPRDRVSPSGRRAPHAAARGAGAAAARGAAGNRQSRAVVVRPRSDGIQPPPEPDPGWPRAPAPSGERPADSAPRRGAHAVRVGSGRRALCGTLGTARVIVRADGEGGLSSLYPSGQGASERW